MAWMAVACYALVFALDVGATERVAAPASAASARGTAALPLDLPLRRDLPGPVDAVPWQLLIVLLVLAVGAGVLVLRRKGSTGLLQALHVPRGARSIERIASQALTPQTSVHAVRWSGEEFLLACTGAQVTVLAHRPVADGAPREEA